DFLVGQSLEQQLHHVQLPPRELGMILEFCRPPVGNRWCSRSATGNDRTASPARREGLARQHEIDRRGNCRNGNRFGNEPNSSLSDHVTRKIFVLKTAPDGHRKVGIASLYAWQDFLARDVRQAVVDDTEVQRAFLLEPFEEARETIEVQCLVVAKRQ